MPGANGVERRLFHVAVMKHAYSLSKRGKARILADSYFANHVEAAPFSSCPFVAAKLATCQRALNFIPRDGFAQILKEIGKS
jgi:hypothetical protein